MTNQEFTNKYFNHLDAHRKRTTTDVVAEQVVIAAVSYGVASILVWMFTPVFAGIASMLSYPFRRREQRRKMDEYKRFLNQTA